MENRISFLIKWVFTQLSIRLNNWQNHWLLMLSNLESSWIQMVECINHSHNWASLFWEMKISGLWVWNLCHLFIENCNIPLLKQLMFSKASRIQNSFGKYQRELYNDWRLVETMIYKHYSNSLLLTYIKRFNRKQK